MIVILSVSVIGMNYHTIRFLGGLPSYSDILFVKVGSDSTLDEAGSILETNLNLLSTLSRTDIKEAENLNGFLKGANSNQITAAISKSLPQHREPSMVQIDTEISNFERSLESYRVTCIIILAHGSELGLAEKQDLLAWENVAESIGRTEASLPIILACQSDNLKEYLPDAITLEGDVDGPASALACSALLVSLFGGDSDHLASITSEFLDRMTCLQERPDLYRPLANWAAISRYVDVVTAATPAPKDTWTNSATGAKIMLMVTGTILLILLDNMSSSATKILSVIAATIVSISVIVELLGEFTGMNQMFKIQVLWSTIDLWDIVKIAVAALVVGVILAFGTPAIILMNAVVKNGAALVLYSMFSLVLSSASYSSIFTQIGKLLGNFIADLFIPILVSLLAMLGIGVGSVARFMMRTGIYLLCTILVYSAVDHLISSTSSIFDVSKTVKESLARSLTMWNICCWTVDWVIYLTGG
ncbi:MAG: hypothetical protein ACFFEJ_19165 [Candidatus Thorarchaeota archaeon]